MRWLGLSLAGPGIWAAGFVLVYALHGVGCAAGWPELSLAPGLDLHRAVLGAAWLATVLAGLALLVALRSGEARPGQRNTAAPGHGLAARLPRDGAWIGLGATLVTLLPVAVASSC